jgi:hypothetical protein
MIRRGVTSTTALIALLWITHEAWSAEDEATFDLVEMSAFFGNQDNPHFYRLTSGQYAPCSIEPNDKVKVYPKLKSKRPWYGSVIFDRDIRDPKAGREFHFVLDESGEELSFDRAAAEKTGPSLLDRLAGLFGGGTTQQFDTTSLQEGSYDRLYFDLNRDLDLTNDPVLKPMKNPSLGAIPRQDANQKLIYDYLNVEFDYGPGLGNRPFRILPRLMIQEHEGEEYALMSFVSTVVRRGTIRIGSREYSVVMGQPHIITGRFDRPFTGLFLTSQDASESHSWWDGEYLMATRIADGELYTTSTTPLGDKLIVKRYQGDTGVLKVGSGGRKLDKLSFRGSVRSEITALPVGEMTASEGAQQCKLPVGDYLPSYLSIDFGRLSINVSENYHSDGKPRERSERPYVYGLKIRKNEPFVLDFSNEPQVMFASPAEGQEFKPGDEIQVYAVLTDPVLDMMIRGLNDTTRKETKEQETGDGSTYTYEQFVSLDPIVKITDASGDVVSEGRMPFG